MLNVPVGFVEYAQAAIKISATHSATLLSAIKPPLRHQLHGSFDVGGIRIIELGELGYHRRVAPCQLLDRHVLRLIVCKAQVSVCATQCVFDFLQVVDGFIDLIDRLFEAIGCEVVVPSERGLECIEAGLKIRDVDVLSPNLRKLRFVLERVHRGISPQRDDWQKELWPDDVHLGVAMEHIHDAGVVQLAVWLQQGERLCDS